MSLINIVLATTEEEKRAAEEALAATHATAPSDWMILAEFVKQCTTLDGKPLAVDEDGQIVLRSD